MPPKRRSVLNKAAGNDGPFLVLLGTTTEEKIVHYNTIAREQGVPIVFKRLHEIVDAFHSALEDTGDSLGNAIQKFKEIDQIIALCRQDKKYRDVLATKCAQWGIPFDPENPENIFFATEDHTFTMPKDIWVRLRKKLGDFYISHETLDSADKNGEAAGPGAETGSILGMGITRFFNHLREASLQAGYTGRKILLPQHVKLVLTRLSDAADVDPHVIETESLASMYVPLEGLEKPFSEPDVPIVTTSHFLASETKSDQPIAKDFDNYLVKESERAKAVKQIFAHICGGSEPSALNKVGDAIRELTSRKRKRDHRRTFTIIQPTEDFLPNLKDYVVKRRISDAGNTFYDAISLTAGMNEADAIVLAPFDETDFTRRLQNYYRFFSIMVAKQLESSNMNVPTAIMDNGCWTPAIETAFYLTNQGMIKDFIRGPLYEGISSIVESGATHIATSYFDIVRSSSRWRREKGILNVFRHRQGHYSRFISPNGHGERKREGALPAKPLFTAAVFISASNDGLKLNEDAKDFGRFLGATNCGLVWGGGDRYAMGSVAEGYRARSGKWLAGFSTPTIIEAETKHGRFPKCDYSELCLDIYERMAKMIEHSNVVHLFPGGAGTAQECLAWLILKNKFPDKMAGKSLVIYSPDLHAEGGYPGKPFWEPVIRAALGDDAWQRMSANHDALADQGIYLATSSYEVKQKNAMLKREWERRRLPNPGARTMPEAIAASPV